MNKYTIVYGQRVGHQFNYMTCVDRVATNNLNLLLQDPKYNGTTYWIFEGWPKIEGDERPIIGAVYVF